MTSAAAPTGTSTLTGNPDRAPYETGGYKWYVAATLCAAHTVSLIDRFVMTLLSEPLRGAMSLSDTQLGVLQGTGFAVLYCAFAVPLGTIADATNRRNLILAGITFWSLATVAAAFTNSFETLLATRILVGMGEACLIPAGMSLLAAYFAPSNLARGTAIFGMGANLGYGAAFVGGGALLAALTAAGGLGLPGFGILQPWQGVFLVAGLSALPVLIMLIWLREPPRQIELGSGIRARLTGMGIGFRYVFANLRDYLPILVIAALTSLTGYAMSSWSASLFVRLHGFTPAQASQVIGLVGIIPGPFGTLAGGMLLDRLRSRGVVAAPMLVMAGGAVAVVGLVAGFVAAPNPVVASIFFSLFMFETFMMLPAVYVGIQMLTPDRFRGVAASFNMMIYTLIGLGLGPTAVGMISDLLPEGDGTLGLAVLSVEAAAAAILVPVAWLGHRRFRQRAVELVEQL